MHGEEDKMWQHRVGFAVPNGLVACINVSSSTSECLMTLQLNMVSRSVSIISVYTLTLTASDDLKDSFYDKLRTTIHNIPTKQCIYILGDFNVRVSFHLTSWQKCDNMVKQSWNCVQKLTYASPTPTFTAALHKECHGVIPTLVTGTSLI